ncbi:MAG: ABC transporter permease, partial [Euryarchaeota archaeon]|nr:ABC transporter permease [Euryarchaeota archaeon]MBU4339524.1 ABC transporter permease [Euryarchaeota archaeon]MBU4454767.1 ABC transporter permease [Euryarchaeota archaeon]MCG2735149.1 ABC transporter permease [Candidatus Methanoperedenaceae archaeon]
MKTYDIFKLSLSHVRKSKMRSWLTIIGIVIGVAAIVAIISIGDGLQASVQKSLGSLGADLITVSPGYSRATGAGHEPGPQGGGGVSTVNLTDKDMNVIKQVPGVIYVNGMVSGRSNMILGTETTSVSITGVDITVWRSIVTTELESGRYLQPGDSNAVVIGYSLAHDVFLQPITQNRPVTIGGKTFKVVGIFAQSGGFGGTDNAVYMPADSARDVITSTVERNHFTSITVKIADQNLADSVKADLEQKLMMSRHVNSRTRDFTVTAFASIQQQISSVFQAITLFLGAIAAVSLLVGAVGIANTMFMSVMERTRQIGLLKSLGATDNEVMKLFLIESGLFG